MKAKASKHYSSQSNAFFTVGLRATEAFSSVTCSYCAYGESQIQQNKTDFSIRTSAKTLFIQLKIASHCLRTSPGHSLGN